MTPGQSDSHARPLDAPGYYPPVDREDLGLWVLHVRGGGAFLMNVAVLVAQAKAERQPGPARDCLQRLYDAIEEALPE